MTLYVDKKYYFDEFKGNKVPINEIEKYLRLAQEKIDSITFNRIVTIGFNNLTKFQQEKIKDAICYQAEYIYLNGYIVIHRLQLRLCYQYIFHAKL